MSAKPAWYETPSLQTSFIHRPLSALPLLAPLWQFPRTNGDGVRERGGMFIILLLKGANYKYVLLQIILITLINWHNMIFANKFRNSYRYQSYQWLPTLHELQWRLRYPRNCLILAHENVDALGRCGQSSLPGWPSPSAIHAFTSNSLETITCSDLSWGWRHIHFRSPVVNDNLLRLFKG